MTDSDAPTTPRRDVLTFGETMLRLSPPDGRRLAQADSLTVWVAGSESNLAAALRLFGVSVTWVSRLPANIVGHKVADALRGYGMDVSRVVWTAPTERVGTFYLEPGFAPRPTQVVYDRGHSAASRLTPADLPDDLFTTHRHLHVSGITVALSPSCAETVADAVRRAKARGLTVSLDVNYRALLWTSEAAAEALRPLLPQADLVLCTRDDAARLFQLSGEDRAVAQTLRARFAVPTVALTTGADGAVACDASGCTAVAALPVETTVDRIGSGDAFAAGFLAGWLAGSVPDGLRWGAAAAALKRTVPGDVLVATRADLDAVLAQEEKPWR